VAEIRSGPGLSRPAIHLRDTVVSVRIALAILHLSASLRERSLNASSVRPAASSHDFFRLVVLSLINPHVHIAFWQQRQFSVPENLRSGQTAPAIIEQALTGGLAPFRTCFHE
jgi:hypothetical protein